MVARLLKINLRPVLAMSLNRLPQDRVQWLLKLMRWQKKSHGGTHDELHPLDGVFGERCFVQVEGVGQGDRCHRVEHRLLAHAFYRKRNRGKVERTG